MINRREQYVDKCGRVIEIREMDEQYIFAGDLSGNRCTCSGPINPETAVPDEIFSRYQREVMKRYGQSAILAFSEYENVIGFITFHPTNASFDELCPGRDPERAKQEFSDLIWPEKPETKLRISCISVAPQYQRNGLASQMVKALIRWAPEWGYQRLHVGANENAWWIPAKPFYDKLGLEVVEEIVFDNPRSDGDKKIFIMERSLV